REQLFLKGLKVPSRRAVRAQGRSRAMRRIYLAGTLSSGMGLVIRRSRVPDPDVLTAARDDLPAIRGECHVLDPGWMMAEGCDRPAAPRGPEAGGVILSTAGGDSETVRAERQEDYSSLAVTRQGSSLFPGCDIVEPHRVAFARNGHHVATGAQRHICYSRP